METGPTINKLDRLSGISGEHLGMMERGQFRPTESEIEALAKALRMTPELLRTQLNVLCHRDRDPGS
jgi:transcriptional regulator with XRE-family HTH domain